jgi:hypothetical protein
MDKKGMAEAVLWIIRIIMLIILVAIVQYIKVTMLTDSLDTYDTEFYLLNTKLLYSPNAMAYESMNTGRTYPGTIDLAKFNEEMLKSSIRKEIPAKLTLQSSDGNIIKQIYSDKERYEILAPLAFARQYDLLNNSYYVLVKDDNGLKPALLTIEMVVSR